MVLWGAGYIDNDFCCVSIDLTPAVNNNSPCSIGFAFVDSGNDFITGHWVDLFIHNDFRLRWTVLSYFSG